MSSNTSKLDYLSKYMEKNPKKDKKKKEKKKKSSKLSPLLCMKEDDENGLPISDAFYEEDDGPTVVIPDGSVMEYDDTPVSLKVMMEGKREGKSMRESSLRAEIDHDSKERRNDRIDRNFRTNKALKTYDSDDCDSSVGRNFGNDHENGTQQVHSKRESRRLRYDSEDDTSHNSVSSNGDYKRNQSMRRKMNSGHSAGLQSSAEFRKKEEMIQRKKATDVKGLEQGETVYRNKSGQAINVHLKSDVSGEKISSPSWNMGTVQKRKLMERFKEEEMASQTAFSRSVDDLDMHRRDVLREGDPMAKQVASSQMKKIYKGPQPKPNRFGIAPGYRWDGIDRGNGFEDQVLAALYSRGRKKDERYKWSCADM